MKTVWIAMVLLCFAKVTLRAQVNDAFSDGDFTANPTWTGDTASWRVVNQELGSRDTTANNTFVLATANTLMTETEWQCKVRLLFSTSGANYVDVFLVSDNAALAGSSTNGYFVRIGGTSDDISLFRKTGTTNVLLIDGINGRSQFSTTNNTILIRARRTGAGNWQLASDNNNGAGWVLEGTATDNQFTTTSWFGFLVRQSTSSFFLRHFMDDVTVAPIVVDSIAPTVLGVAAPSDTTLQVTFSEPVLASSGSYTVNPGGLVPVTVSTVSSTILRLTFAQQWVSGQPYTAVISAVQDLAGNALTVPVSFSFTWTAPFLPTTRQLVLNELLADPSPPVGLPNTEFVEILNTSGQSINLQGYTLSDPSTTGAIQSSVILPTGGLAVLCPIASVGLFAQAPIVIGLSSWPSLNNDRDTLRLRRPDGVLLDEVAYSSSWIASSVKRDGGWTLEQINPFTPCTGQNNWAESVHPSGGTPGAQNSRYDTTPDTTPPVVAGMQLLSTQALEVIFSEPLTPSSLSTAQVSFNGVQALLIAFVPGSLTRLLVTPPAFVQQGQLYTVVCTGFRDCPGNLMLPFTTVTGLGELPLPGELVFTEIMVDESPQVGLPLSEWVEIHNKGNRLLQLEGVQFADLSAQRTLPRALILPDSFVVLAPQSNLALFPVNAYPIVGLSSWISLTNSGKDLRLLSPLGDVLDEVAYTDNWYGDNVKRNGGWSLELINPRLPCSNEANWSASTDPSGGTPGRVNSIWAPANDTVGPQLQVTLAISPFLIRLQFNEPLGASPSATIQFTPSVGTFDFVRQRGSSTALAVLQDSLISGRIYTVTISGVEDCSGNQSGPITFTVGLGGIPSRYDLLITEIFADESPVVGLPSSEYVEIMNVSNTLLNTSGVVFTDGSTSTTLQVATLLPGERVVLCPSARASDFVPVTSSRIFGLSSWPGLNNAGESLMLLNAQGALVHAVDYRDSWYNDAVKKEGGWSLEMIDTTLPCGGAENWAASVHPSGGTPGRVNSIAASRPDLTPPVLLRADVLNPLTLQLSFNETLDSAQAASPGNISITSANSLAVPSAVRLRFPLFNAMEVLLSDSLRQRIPYTLTISNKADCSGNTAVSIKLPFQVPEPASKGDVVINEVLFNPPTGGRDFVELWNVSSKPINLQGWSLANIADDTLANFSTLTTQAYVVAPGSFVTLTSSGSLTQRDYPAFRTNTLLVMASLPAYNNTSGTVILIDQAANVVDSFPYHEDMHFRLLDDVKGFSLEKIQPSLPATRTDAWKSASSTVKATPGYVNSQYAPLDGSSATLTIDPPVFIPDGDGDRDLCFIRYQLDKPGKVGTITVFDRDGRPMRSVTRNSLLGTEGFFTWDGTTDVGDKARVGSYLVLMELFELGGTTNRIKATISVGANFR